MTFVVALVWALQAEPAEAGAGAVLSRHFAPAGEERIREAQARLDALLRSLPEPRRAEIVKALPKAARYHEHAVESSRRNRPVPPQQVREGYDLQLAYFEAGVRAEVSRPTDPDSLARSRAQAAALFEEARRELKARLPGAAASSWVDAQIGALERSWGESLDKPFQSPLPRPLSPEELEDVRRGLRESAARVVPAPLPNDADYADPERLGRTRALPLLEEVRESLYRATRHAARDLIPHETRFDEWLDRVEQIPEEDFKGSEAFREKLPALEDEARRRALKPPSSPRSEVARKDAGDPTPAGPTSSAPAPAAAPRSRAPWIWALALVAAVALGLALRRRAA